MKYRFFKTNKTLKILFSLQVILVTTGLIAGDNPDNIITTQWMCWSLAVIVAVIISLIISVKFLKYKKLDRFTTLVLLTNIIGIAWALFVHYSSTLG